MRNTIRQNFLFAIALICAFVMVFSFVTKATEQIDEQRINKDSCLVPTNDEYVEISEKMKIEIWSDVVCPWCYLGKQRLEKALAKFDQSDQVEVIYRSFQLDPTVNTDTNVSTIEYLAKSQQTTLEDARLMNLEMKKYANQNGLKYRLDNQVQLNTLNAHILLQYAKDKGVQVDLKTVLIDAYFVRGVNIDDVQSLVKLGIEVGLDGADVTSILKAKRYLTQVQADIQEASQRSVPGVPFFVINEQTELSGARSEQEFLTALKTAFKEWNQQRELDGFMEDNICTPNKNCK